MPFSGGILLFLGFSAWGLAYGLALVEFAPEIKLHRGVSGNDVHGVSLACFLHLL